MTRSRSRAGSPRTVLGCALVSLGVLASATACGSNNPSARATDAPTGSINASSAAASTSASPSAGSDPYAGWVVAKKGNAEFRLPPGWTLRPLNGQLGFTTPADKVTGASAGVTVFSCATTSAPSTSFFMSENLKMLRGEQLKGLKRLPDVTLGGVTFYHLYGETPGAFREDDYGTVRNGYDVIVKWTFQSGISAGRAADLKLINQVMATYKPL